MNPTDVAERAPQLPVPILLVVTFLSGLTLLLAIRRLDSLPGTFLLVAIWLRIISGAYYTITFAPIVGGLSINALLSVATVMTGAMLIDKSTFVQRWTLPIYFLIFVVAASSVVNKTASGFVDVFFKWGYVIVLIAATRQAMAKSGASTVLYMVLYCYCPIFIFQMLSLVLGYGKDTEGADALSYIGGYNHEAAFSLMIATFAVAVFLNPRMSFGLKVGLLVFSAFSVLLANYRTAIISMLPLILGVGFVEGLALFNRRSRSFALVLLIPVALAGAALGWDALAQRFADLGTIVTEYNRFMIPPEQFSEPDKKILSGRLFIWSNYINGYLDGSDLQLLFGNGPNGWMGRFVKYAHNTLVSYLFEFGPFGVLGLLVIWGTFVRGALLVQDQISRRKLLLAQLSFFLFNLATMPHWLVEGIIFFALVQGTLLYRLTAQSSNASPGALTGPLRSRFAHRQPVGVAPFRPEDTPSRPLSG